MYETRPVCLFLGGDAILRSRSIKKGRPFLPGATNTGRTHPPIYYQYSSWAARKQPGGKMDLFDRSAFFATHYPVDWTRQVLALAILRQGAQKLLSQYTATPLQTAQVDRSMYWSPSTYHRYYRRPLVGVAAEAADTIPCLFADIDWHDSTEPPPYWGEVYVQLLDADLTPTLLVQTPRGLHLYWYLQEPLRMRWERSSQGVWAPMAGAQKGLAWWRDTSFALHRRLISLGLPADTSAAGTPARLLRTPHPWTVRHWDSSTLWTLDAVAKRCEEHRMTKRYAITPGRRVALDQGVEQGQRNDHCWRLALRLAAEYREAPEAGWRQLSEWCSRCTPAYPEREARPVWAWAVRRTAEGRAYVYRSPSERTREAQGRYAARIYRSRTDEAIAGAVAQLQAQGIADPWSTPGALKVIAGMAGISYRTVKGKKKQIEEKKSLTEATKGANQT